MAGWTNRGKYRVLGGYFQGTTIPTNFYAALITSAVAPTADTNDLGSLTQVTAGTGYTAGGTSLSRNATDFDVLTEDDTNDRALVQIKDLAWTGDSGSVADARYCVLTDDNATSSDRDVVAFWDLVSDRTVTTGQTLTLQNCELRLTE